MIPLNGHKKIIRPSDILFAASLLGAAVICALFLYRLPQGQTAVFRLDGEEVGRYSLSEDRTVEIHGQYLNIFEIADGCVRMADTTCPNHTCEAAGAVSQAGTSIICAPNHVSVSVEGGGGLDAATG